MNANDLIIYCRATEEEAKGIKYCLDNFCKSSGQDINFEKSAIHFSANVGRNMQQKIMDILQVNECDHKGKYLGMPFCKGKSQTKAFSRVIEKIKMKLARWKGQPADIMQTYLMPFSRVGSHGGESTEASFEGMGNYM